VTANPGVKGLAMPPIVSIVGRSESGKTTLIEKLIPELMRRGYRIGTIKHTHHAVDMDRSGKDSARHRAAGATAVMLASTAGLTLVKRTENESLDSLSRYFEDVDLLVTEGYKREAKPKIEVARAALGTDLMCRGDPHLLAVAADFEMALSVPVFSLEDVGAIADFIERRVIGGVR
jgi:molybdopterin-guanine dinucleotide biosynthesis protein MobB